MKRINYKSDFSLLLDLYDDDGMRIGFPDYNFDINVISSGGNSFKAYRKGDMRLCVRMVDDKVLVVCDNHKLLPGSVSVELDGQIPDNAYPDGYRRWVRKYPTEVVLTDGNSDAESISEIRVVIPVVDEKIDNYVTEKEQARQEAEALRVEAERKRDEAETLRTIAEANRETWVEQSSKRLKEGADILDAAEDERVANEDSRILAERDRQSAETDRSDAETQRRENEMRRQTNEEERAIQAREFESAEEERVKAEEAREEADAQREELSKHVYYSIDFGETSTLAIDFNLRGSALEILEVDTENVAAIDVVSGEDVSRFEPPFEDSDEPMVTIPAKANVTWEIERITEGLLAVIAVHGKLS